MSPLPTTVDGALAHGRALGLDRLDVQLLLAHALQQSRTWLISHGDAVLSAEQLQQFSQHLSARLDLVPVAYLLGEQEFYGLVLKVSPAVLVPRADTETLVDWALELLAQNALPGQVADLGTGSGAIALAIKKFCPGACVHAIDVSLEALQLARQNAEHLGLRIETHQGSWFQPLAGQFFNLIVSNPPYIDGHDEHLSALRHEPTLALTPGGDGLDCICCIIKDAPDHLVPGGHLLIEHGYDQAQAVVQLLQNAGFEAVQTRQDLGQRDRVTGARLKPR